jgi:hypothetical protein
VTATLTGLFVAGDTSLDALSPGYGHFGCCRLFVIQKVTDVAAVRTASPAGGRFRCATEAWTVQADRVGGWPSGSGDEFDVGMHRLVATVAEHWEDAVDATQGRLSCWQDQTTAPATQHCKWTAPDLTTVYELATPLMPAMAQSVVITRKKCEPANPEDAPWLASTPIRCDNLSWNWNGTDTTASELQRTADERNQGWRSSDTERVAQEALQRAVEQWRITASPATLHCDEPMGDDEQEIAGCAWTAPEDMQEYRMVLRKVRSMKKNGREWKDVVWVATDAYATVCRMDQ